MHGSHMVIKINLLQLCRHENIIRFYGSVESATNHEIYLEYVAGGSLFNKIERDGSLLEGVAQHYFKQLITGMAYLHSLGVAHRDLKPENLLIANNDILKICDFGLSAFFRDRTTNEKQMLTTYCGTKPYISPEMLSKTPYHGEPVDIWSCGIILTAMLTGVFPWAEASDQI
ncbi:unnamed protein product, partial [Rotaria sp. Silwood2]